MKKFSAFFNKTKSWYFSPAVHLHSWINMGNQPCECVRCQPQTQSKVILNVKTYEFAPIDAPQQITIISNSCLVCQEDNEIYLFEKDYKSWLNGDYIQSAFPYLSSQQRELIKTGIHPDCWDKLYPPDEEDF